jgi:hypothetical protein
VVEIELNLNVGVDGGFITGELKLLDEVFMRALGEASALIGIKVDVVDEEGSRSKGRNAEESVATSGSAETVGTIYTSNVALGLVAELNVDTDLVVLESNERKSKTRVAAEPELKRNVKSSSLSLNETSTGKVNGVTDHVVVTNLETGLLGKLVPDGEPVTVLLVNLLSTNVNGDVLDEAVTNVVNPTEVSGGGGRSANLGKGDLKVDAGNKITIASNSGSYALAEIRGTGEGLFDRLHSEVSVASVDDLKESNLGIACKVDILSTVSN